jgi:hypothetical protein
MMAKSEMAETCGYLRYTYKYSYVMTAISMHNLFLYIELDEIPGIF